MDDISPLYHDYYHFIDLEYIFYEKLATREELNDPSLTYESLFDLCDAISPSLVLGTGGILFELFILRFGAHKHRSLLRKQLDLRPGKPLHLEDHNEIVRQYSLLFWFEVISKLPLTNRNCNTQLFLFTLALEYRGLSRLGIQYLALCGAATNPRTFDRKRLQELSHYDSTITRLVDNGQAVFGFDNYSHFFWTPKIAVGQSSSKLGTNCTVGAISIPQITLPNNILYNLNGDIIPSTPRVKVTLACYVKPFINDLKHILCDIKDVTGDHYTYWPLARVVRENISTVPASVQIQGDKQDEKDENQDHSRGLKHFRPWFVSADDPSSNFGTTNTIVRFFKEGMEALKRKYLYVRMDVDLWMKWLRVMFLHCASLLS